ncbi:hypothetical protein PR001_g5617 [Phytophthora rubi]|uniref:Uncharacterized protein n=1 Tax=Phytophthora rubi TaxID=129364 RepID=A0A6A3L7G7_9STRA|nr:hypothetical protein PR002_g14980 [Phytophthora rubi]KAE9043840.1 hypothetical protein PR001_g5617 [Phytophthora rubi]
MLSACPQLRSVAIWERRPSLDRRVLGIIGPKFGAPGPPRSAPRAGSALGPSSGAGTEARPAGEPSSASMRAGRRCRPGWKSARTCAEPRSFTLQPRPDIPTQVGVGKPAAAFRPAGVSAPPAVAA